MKVCFFSSRLANVCKSYSYINCAGCCESMMLCVFWFFSVHIHIILINKQCFLYIKKSYDVQIFFHFSKHPLNVYQNIQGIMKRLFEWMTRMEIYRSFLQILHYLLKIYLNILHCSTACLWYNSSRQWSVCGTKHHKGGCLQYI